MALIEARLDALLCSALRHLRPYLDDFVVIGGVANAMLRRHPLAARSGLPILGTTDIDMASLERVPRGDRLPLSSLLDVAGLQPQFHPEYTPPIMKFVSKEDPNLEIEFLCPLAGSEHSRGGKRKVATEIQADVTAQQLRYLDLLLFEPWSLDAQKVSEFAELPAPTNVRVPNPASYVMQKILIRKQGRAPADCDKDCGYIYEIAVTFRDALPDLTALARRLRAHVPKAWWRRFEADFRRVFADPQAPGPIAAARQFATAGLPGPSTTPVTEEMISLAVTRLAEALLARADTQ